MRILIFILLFVSAPLFGTTWYVSGSGDDDTGDGSIANPWQHLSYACDQATAGDLIYIQSDLIDNDQCYVPVGVSIQGLGQRTITTSYVATSESDGFIKYYSAPANPVTAGNQSLSYVTVKGYVTSGGVLVATRGIWIGYRSNVDIHHCVIQDFNALGVHYKNEPNWMTPPTAYATGNDFYNNTVRNCAGDREVVANGSGLRMDGQTDMNVYNCTFIDNERYVGSGGDSFNLSNSKAVKIYDCDFYRHDHENGQWNFYAEIFHLQGGVEIYNCNFYGSANLDFSNAFDGESVKGSYAFTAKIYNNYFTTTTGNQIATAFLSGRVPIAITVEKGDMEYFYIYNNHIKGYASGIYIDSNSGSSAFQHIYVYNNLLDHLGSLDYAWTWAVAVFPEGPYTIFHDNIHFWNNVLYGGSGYCHGIRWTAQGTLTNSSIKNNIFYGFDGYPVYFDIQSGRTFSMNNVSVTYNDFYSNGTNSVYINSSISQTSVDRTTGNMTVDPLWVSMADFRLQEGSPMIGEGIDVGLSTDYLGNAWLDPPSMGAYEFGTPIEPPIIIDYPTGLIKSNNRFIILNNKLLKLE